MDFYRDRLHNPFRKRSFAGGASMNPDDDVLSTVSPVWRLAASRNKSRALCRLLANGDEAAVGAPT
jgi:hypothetical protein